MRRDDMAQVLANAYAVIAAHPLAVGPDAFVDDTNGGDPHGPGTDNEAAIIVPRCGRREREAARDYDPSGPVTRGQLASYLARYLQVLVADGELVPLSPAG